MRIEELDTPALTVDLDIMERNLRSLSDYCRKHGLKLRPHTKTHKIPAIAKMQLASGCSGITVAKVGEAAVMAAAGLEDILIAYPVVGQSKCERLAKLAQQKITVSLDSIEVAQGISKPPQKQVQSSTFWWSSRWHAPLWCPVIDAWLSVAQAVDKLSGLGLSGLMFYPGHIWDALPEQGPALDSISRVIEEIRLKAKQSGLNCEVVSGGSTPTAYNSHLVRGITEVRPGTYVFNDMNETKAGYSQLADCALRVQVTVVSKAVQGRAMVDGGSKTFSGDRLISGDKQGFGFVTEHPDTQFTSMSEEHGHLDLGPSDRVNVGDRLHHPEPCLRLREHANQIYYHRKGIVEGSGRVEEGERFSSQSPP
jgi:D-serine deaminase-like pyridoxal phosphate-dependent protein